MEDVPNAPALCWRTGRRARHPRSLHLVRRSAVKDGQLTGVHTVHALKLGHRLGAERCHMLTKP
jgi:hypothetical protein